MSLPKKDDDGGLTAEQREQALYAARGGVLDLITAHPELGIRVSPDDLTTIYLAGIVAGCDATIRVLDTLTP